MPLGGCGVDQAKGLKREGCRYAALPVREKRRRTVGRSQECCRDMAMDPSVVVMGALGYGAPTSGATRCYLACAAA